jgi:hypothetical protein
MSKIPSKGAPEQSGNRAKPVPDKKTPVVPQKPNRT